MAAKTAADVGTTGPEMSGSRTAVLQRLRSHVVRRLGWGVADQVVSSLSNFAVGIFVVHVLGAVQFGAFSLAFVTYGFVLNASRGLATDPLMVRFSGTDLATWRRAVTACTGTAALVGLVAGACVLAADAVLSGAVGAAFLALGLTLPGLLLQDSWRYSFFALGRGSQAFLNDTIWVVTLLPALELLRVIGHADVFWFVFAWGITGGAAAAVGSWQARVIPKLAGAWGWVSKHRDLGLRYLAEGTSQSAAVQIRAYSIGLVLGLAALGSMQAASTLFGPMTILFLGMSLVAIPEAARVLHRSPRHLPVFCVVITCGLSLAGLAWGTFLLVAVPRGFGNWLLGPIWRLTYPLVLPSMLGAIGQAVTGGASTGLHALGAARRSLRLTVLGSVLYVIASLGGAIAAGAAGAVWGTAISIWLSSVYGWWQLRVAQREAGHSSAGDLFQLIRPNWRHRTSPVRRAKRVKVPTAVARALLGTGGIALLAVVSATGWTLAHHLSGTHEAANAQARATEAPTHASAAKGAPVIERPGHRGHVLKPISVVSYDPYGDGLGENSQLSYLAIDDNPATAWHTDWYTTPSFGGLKLGTGLLLDMGRTVTISTVQVLLDRQPGADFEVRIGTSLTGMRSIAEASDAGGQVSLDLATPARGRFVLIWFTQLPPADAPSGTFQASVYNVSLEGWM